VTERARRPSSLRAVFLLMSVAAAAYVAVLGAYALLELEPATATLRGRAGALAAEYDSLGVHTRALAAAFDAAARLSRQRALTAADRDSADRLRAVVRRLAARSAGMQASALLSHIPAEMRLALAATADLEANVSGVLLEALTDLGSGDAGSAAAWIARADSSRAALLTRLGEAQRLGLSDLSERERVLGERATRVAFGVAVWLALGAALVAFAQLVIHRRLYAPLGALERGLARVADGDLDASLPVPRDDEVGRLAAHFNAMTAVLRAHPEVEALRREQFLVEMLMEHVPDSIYFKDAASRFLRVNRAMAQRIGLRDPAQAVGRTDADFFAPDHAAAALKDEQEIMRTGQPIVGVEERETWPDGRSAWVSTTKMPLRDASGSPVGTFGISRDITERMEAERRLLESEVRFRTAFMTGTDAFLIAGMSDGRIYEANDQFLAMYGYRRDEVVGHTSLELGLWPDPEQRRSLISRLLAEGQVRNVEVFARRKSGEVFPTVASVAALPGEDPRLLLSVIRDVTAQRRADDALRSMEEQFRQAQRLEAVGRLAGGVAHDFNNILTAITGYAQLMLLDFRENDPRRTDLDEILAASQRAAALTRQLLAFSRKQVLQPRVLDLNDVVKGLEKMLRRLIGEDISLAFTAGEGLKAVRADPGQIEQVLLNLAVNARDAMPQGGKLTIETQNAELDEAYAATHAGASQGDYVMLAVSDTGIGMDAETQSHIFEPFFTTKELGKGTGLGLATVHGIVTQSGGRIEVYSEPGRGAAFKIYLPAVAGAAESLDVIPAAPGAGTGHETILVVEDDRAVREVVAETLSQRGYRVLRAADGAAALEVAKGAGGGIRLLLTDIVMPGLGGRELAQALRAGHPGIRLLYMSGYTDDAVIRHGILEEGTPFLQKPFTAEVLALKVREVLDRKS